MDVLAQVLRTVEWVHVQAVADFAGHPAHVGVDAGDVDRDVRVLDRLPTDFREIIVLREIEGLSYKEIAVVVRVPIGTVMSRLARARERLLAMLKPATPMETLR